MEQSEAENKVYDEESDVVLYKLSRSDQNDPKFGETFLTTVQWLTKCKYTRDFYTDEEEVYSREASSRRLMYHWVGFGSGIAMAYACSRILLPWVGRRHALTPQTVNTMRYATYGLMSIYGLKSGEAVSCSHNGFRACQLSHRSVVGAKARVTFKMLAPKSDFTYSSDVALVQLIESGESIAKREQMRKKILLGHEASDDHRNADAIDANKNEEPDFHKPHTRTGNTETPFWKKRKDNHSDERFPTSAVSRENEYAVDQKEQDFEPPFHRRDHYDSPSYNDHQREQYEQPAESLRRRRRSDKKKQPTTPSGKTRRRGSEPQHVSSVDYYTGTEANRPDIEVNEWGDEIVKD